MTKRNNEIVMIDAFGNQSNLDRNQDNNHSQSDYLRKQNFIEIYIIRTR